MTCPAGESIGISRQRGFWLRCFLGAGICAALVLPATRPVQAQLEAPGPLHLWRLHGVVVSGAGKPVPGETVNLVRDEKIVYTTTTDSAGRFDCPHVTGRYWLRMKPKDASIVNREVVVGDEALMLLRKSAFYLILGPSRCTDDCSQVFTSKSDFQKAVKRDMAHPY